MHLAEDQTSKLEAQLESSILMLGAQKATWGRIELIGRPPKDTPSFRQETDQSTSLPIGWRSPYYKAHPHVAGWWEAGRRGAQVDHLRVLPSFPHSFPHGRICRICRSPAGFGGTFFRDTLPYTRWDCHICLHWPPKPPQLIGIYGSPRRVASGTAQIIKCHSRCVLG